MEMKKIMKVSLFQKYFFVSSILPKSKQKHFELLGIVVLLSYFFSFFVRVFLEELKTPKSPFEMN